MCQMANGHTIINTGVHPIDYFTDNELWADCLVRMRELYDFDGILCHKPGRVDGIMNLVERTDYCLLYTSPSPRDKRQSRMPSSA